MVERAAPASGEAADLPARWLDGLLAWNALRSRLPDTPEPYVEAVNTLSAAGRGLDADIVLGEAARRFYGNPALAINHAIMAEQRRDWPLALARWQHVRTLFPNLPASYLRAGIVLRKETRQLDEAEAILEAGAARFPQRSDIWSEYAAVAVDRKDRANALRRYEAMRERFPAAAGAWRWIATLLREEGRFEEAEAALDEAMVRFPDEAGLLTDRAWLAGSRQAWADAVVRWDAVRTALPDNVLGYWMAGSVLSARLNRHDEAEALLCEGVARFPDHLEQAMDYARVAERRGDLPEALLRWERLAARHPDNQTIAGKVANLRGQLEPSPATPA